MKNESGFRHIGWIGRVDSFFDLPKWFLELYVQVLKKIWSDDKLKNACRFLEQKDILIAKNQISLIVAIETNKFSEHQKLYGMYPEPLPSNNVHARKMQKYFEEYFGQEGEY